MAQLRGSRTAKKWMSILKPFLSEHDVLQAQMLGLRWRTEKWFNKPVLSDSP